MNVLYVLVPLALALALGGVAAFRWAVRDGQFDDVETPALRVLLDEEGVQGAESSGSGANRRND